MVLCNCCQRYEMDVWTNGGPACWWCRSACRDADTCQVLANEGVSTLYTALPYNQRRCAECSHQVRLHTWEGCCECELRCKRTCCSFNITTIDDADNINCWFCGNTLRVIDG